MLEFRQVSFAYNPTEPLLKQITFTIKPGEFTFLAGRNGSGKTTLTRLMMALRHPTAGSILLNGRETAKAEPADMAAHIGYVFQNPDRQLFKNTVLEEVAYGPAQLGLSKQAALQEAKKVIDQLGLTPWQEAQPAALPRNLKQKTTIASALAMKPKLLILDEPTSGQDAFERASLLSLLTELNEQGMALLLVTHDMDLIAQYGKRVIVLYQGELVFDGSPQNLFLEPHLSQWGLCQPLAAKISQELFQPSLPALTIAQLQAQLKGRLRSDEHV